MLRALISFVLLFEIAVASLFASDTSTAETEIFVIPGGQGNFSIIRYHSQVMIIDAGSSEMTFPAIYNRKASQESITYELKKPVLSVAQGLSESFVKGESKLPLRSELDHFLDSDETSSNISSDSQVSTPPTKKIKPETKKKKVKDTYEDFILQFSRDHLPKDGDVLHVKTIVVSHGDKDHYNFIPKLFDDENPVIIETLILDGFAEDYDASFREWIDRQHKYQQTISASFKIIYTGTSTGEEGSAPGNWPAAGYARAYCSKLEEKTPTEQRIEYALQFVQEGALAPSILEILSMNAGHAMEEVTQGTERRKIVRRANYDKNANSIVLRVKTPDRSMLFAGDADNATWDHIFTNYYFELERLRTDYLMISHHGSREEGATRRDVLSILQPKACIVSVGRHLGYHHPHQEAIDLLLSATSLYKTDAYRSVSYFGPDRLDPKKLIHKSKKVQKAIFSTLNSGVISILLGERFEVHTSQTKGITYTDSTNATSKFSVDYSQVMSPAEGETVDALIGRFIHSIPERQKSVSIWGIADKKRNTIAKAPHSGDSSSNATNPDELTTHYDLLADRESNRLYLLETIE